MNSNSTDYQNFLSNHRDLSFKQSMIKFRSAGGHIGSANANKVYNAVKPNKQLSQRMQSVSRSRNKTDIRVVTFGKQTEYDLLTNHKRKISKKSLMEYIKAKRTFKNFKKPLFRYYFVAIISYNNEHTANFFGMQDLSEIGLVKTQLEISGNRGLNDSGYNIYDMKKGDYL